MTHHTHCPNCGAPLDKEEQQLQECYSCGWPDDCDTPLAEPSNSYEKVHLSAVKPPVLPEKDG